MRATIVASGRFRRLAAAARRKMKNFEKNYNTQNIQKHQTNPRHIDLWLPQVAKWMKKPKINLTTTTKIIK